MLKSLLFILLISSVILGQETGSQQTGQSYTNNLVSFFAALHTSNSFSVSRSDSSQNYHSDPTYSIGAEFFIRSNPNNINGGIGVEYQFKSTAPGVTGHFKNLPIYLFLDIPFGDNLVLWFPRLSVKAGFNFFSAAQDFIFNSIHTNGGIFYSIGTASRLNERFLLRLMYCYHDGKITSSNNEYIFNNSNFSLSLAVLF